MDLLKQITGYQVKHFINRARERAGLNLTEDDVLAINAIVQKQITPNNLLNDQPDGKQLVSAQLGKFGKHPVVFDPTTQTVVTILKWSMVEKYHKRLKAKRRKRELKELHASQPLLK